MVAGGVAAAPVPFPDFLLRKTIFLVRLQSRKAVYLALRITTLQKAWNVYSICSLDSSVQVIEIPPFTIKCCIVLLSMAEIASGRHLLLNCQVISFF